MSLVELIEYGWKIKNVTKLKSKWKVFFFSVWKYFENSWVKKGKVKRKKEVFFICGLIQDKTNKLK